MTAAKKIKDLLEKAKINYELLEHDTAFTAMEVAQAQHVPGRQMVKSVIVTADGNHVMCVMPAIHKINFDKLKKALGCKEVHLANEKEIAALFPGFDIGTMPPFGQLAGLKVYVDHGLEENETITFNAGTHTDVIRIKFKDFVALAKPVFADFGKHI